MDQDLLQLRMKAVVGHGGTLKWLVLQLPLPYTLLMTGRLYLNDFMENEVIIEKDTCRERS